MRWFAGYFLVLVVPLLVACGDQESQAALPVAIISTPETNSRIVVGQEVLIAFNAADVGGVAQVELTIDGQPVMVETVEPPVNSYVASYRWTADKVGSHVIEFRAFNVEQVASDPAQVFVTAISAGDEPIPTPTAVAIIFPTASPIPPAPTATPPLPTATPGSAPEATVTPAESEARVTALVGLNIRLGPGTNYPVIGRLAANESARVTGRDQFSGWWQIDYSSDRGSRGWIAAGSDFSTATNAEEVPVVEAPPLEATPEPTEPAPTPSPDDARPVIFSFTADRYTIAAGERVTLSWDLANATAAFLRYDGREEGVVAPGNKVVSPELETTYTLVARNGAGETIAEVTIKIGSAAPTPAPIYRDGKIRIANGQGVDFDQGLVLSGPDPGVDFLWNGQRQQFFPQGGASGALLGRSYGEITLADCRATAYDKPIDGIDGSTQVTGCYLTNEGRYGKFFVSEWDLAANLTVEWATWR